MSVIIGYLLSLGMWMMRNVSLRNAVKWNEKHLEKASTAARLVAALFVGAVIFLSVIVQCIFTVIVLYLHKSLCCQ